MILLIDNYDSFSYNLYQLIGAINPEIKVIRNDELTAEEIEALKPEAIILSPGPGRPQNAGCCIEVVQKLGGKIPILGVCLGHQVICEAYGGVPFAGGAGGNLSGMPAGDCQDIGRRDHGTAA